MTNSIWNFLGNIHIFTTVNEIFDGSTSRRMGIV